MRQYNLTNFFKCIYIPYNYRAIMLSRIELIQFRRDANTFNWTFNKYVNFLIEKIIILISNYL